jgi:hypothetical protein
MDRRVRPAVQAAVAAIEAASLRMSSSVTTTANPARTLVVVTLRPFTAKGFEASFHVLLRRTSHKSAADNFGLIPANSDLRGALGPCAIANHAQTRRFRSILRQVRKLRNRMVERNGFELPVPPVQAKVARFPSVPLSP